MDMKELAKALPANPKFKLVYHTQCLDSYVALLYVTRYLRDKYPGAAISYLSIGHERVDPDNSTLLMSIADHVQVFFIDTMGPPGILMRLLGRNIAVTLITRDKHIVDEIGYLWHESFKLMHSTSKSVSFIASTLLTEKQIAVTQHLADYFSNPVADPKDVFYFKLGLEQDNFLAFPRAAGWILYKLQIINDTHQEIIAIGKSWEENMWNEMLQQMTSSCCDVVMKDTLVTAVCQSSFTYIPETLLKEFAHKQIKEKLPGAVAVYTYCMRDGAEFTNWKLLSVTPDVDVAKIAMARGAIGGHAETAEFNMHGRFVHERREHHYMMV
jgi:hypothetical protein